MKISRIFIFPAIAAMLVVGLLPACSAPPAGNQLKLLPVKVMPADVQSAPVTVRQSYQFSAANPSLMKNIPCYCGCGDIGHTSNYSCYVSSVDAVGNINFDNHALGCSICVDITQDTIRLVEDGKELDEVLAYINSTYSKFGVSNIK